MQNQQEKSKKVGYVANGLTFFMSLANAATTGWAAYELQKKFDFKNFEQGLSLGLKDAAEGVVSPEISSMYSDFSLRPLREVDASFTAFFAFMSVGAGSLLARRGARFDNKKFIIGAFLCFVLNYTAVYLSPWFLNPTFEQMATFWGYVTGWCQATGQTPPGFLSKIVCAGSDASYSSPAVDDTGLESAIGTTCAVGFATILANYFFGKNTNDREEYLEIADREDARPEFG